MGRCFQVLNFALFFFVFFLYEFFFFFSVWLEGISAVQVAGEICEFCFHYSVNFVFVWE